MKKQSLPKLKAKAQIIFNEYIRKRDADLPCISCGQFKPLQAGHYYSVKGYDGLRFDEYNVNGECAGCNCFDESHLIGYGDNLKEKIGQEAFEWLKDAARQYKKTGNKWSRSQIEEIIKVYTEKLKQL